MNLKTSSSNILKLERSNKNKCHFKLPLSRTYAIHDEEGYNNYGVCYMLVMSKAISLMPAFFKQNLGYAGRWVESCCEFRRCSS